MTGLWAGSYGPAHGPAPIWPGPGSGSYGPAHGPAPMARLLWPGPWAGSLGPGPWAGSLGPTHGLAPMARPMGRLLGPGPWAGSLGRPINPVHWVDECLYWVDGGSINPSTQLILQSGLGPSGVQLGPVSVEYGNCCCVFQNAGIFHHKSSKFTGKSEAFGNFTFDFVDRLGQRPRFCNVLAHS